MIFQDFYIDQRVRILSWDELKAISHDDVNGIYLPDHSFFHNNMKYLCNATLTIINSPSYSDDDEDYLSPTFFSFDDPSLSLSQNIPRAFGFDSWHLSPAMLTPLDESAPTFQSSISFDQLLKGGA